MNTSERSMQMRLAAHRSWVNTPDRASRTAAARKASHHTRFIDQARALHPTATETQIAQVAESLRKVHYTELAFKSVQARRRKGQAVKEAKRKAIADELATYESGTTTAA
ncbi:hypothetical protein [Streptomyces sp. NBC_01506]|uniref:hypothetical protein n=1 Tax=Streptomyces sp. NBC_01506 TaxID=2903887 RepID=UPI003866ECBC